MKLLVEPQLCGLLGICQEVAPDLFEVPVEGEGEANEARRLGYSRVRVPEVSDPETLERARQAVLECPMGAISLTRGEGSAE